MSAAGGRRSVAAGVAAGGIVAGHWLAFAVREPDAGARAVLLEATGHQWLPQLTVVAVLTAAVALLAVPLRGDRAHVGAYGQVARLLAVLQAGGFLLLESLERTVAHAGGHAHPDSGLLDAPVLIGLVAQVAVAGAAAALLVALAQLAVPARPRDIVLTGPPRPRPVAAPARAPERPGHAAHPLRGPPVPSRV